LNDGGDVQTGSGILSFTSGATIGGGSQSLSRSTASSSISGTIQLPANASLRFDVAPYSPSAPSGLPPELDVPAVISGAADDPQFKHGAINKLGLGSMRVSGNNTTFAGSALIDNGKLIVAGAGALGSTNGGTFVNNTAVLALEGSTTLNNESLYIN